MFVFWPPSLKQSRNMIGTITASPRKSNKSSLVVLNAFPSFCVVQQSIYPFSMKDTCQTYFQWSCKGANATKYQEDWDDLHGGALRALGDGGPLEALNECRKQSICVSQCQWRTHLCVAEIWHSSTQAILLYSISSDKSRTMTNLTATQSFSWLELWTKLSWSIIRLILRWGVPARRLFDPLSITRLDTSSPTNFSWQVCADDVVCLRLISQP